MKTSFELSQALSIIGSESKFLKQYILLLTTASRQGKQAKDEEAHSPRPSSGNAERYL
jgi:hypothetical protein